MMRMERTAGFAVLLGLVGLGLSIATCHAATVLVEAEQFDDLGGWSHDAQFMDQMGSPFLLAHGLGRPVRDAKTHVRFPEAGRYRLWVRTRDWVATWNAPGAPGRFQVVLNGRPIETTFGIEGAAWHWQDGGVVEITVDVLQSTVALHDLTGFEGRCDAIVFTTESEMPPESLDELKRYRQRQLNLPDKPRDVGEFDFVVVGGGIAGTCASLSAARLGLKVALIQDRPVVGGNNSSEVRVWLQGARNKPPYPRVGDIVRELEQKRRAHYGPANTADLYEDDRKLGLLKAERNVSLFLGHRAIQVDAAGQSIRSVVAQNTTTAERLCFRGRWFADCTGDGGIGFLAGADYEMTVPGHMGRCNLWNVIDTKKRSPFPRCPWALDLADKPFPGRNRELLGVKADRRGIEALGGWFWESGFDHDPFEKNEYLRDWNFRAMYGAWDALKNVDERYGTYKLNWAAFVSGKRESRRLMGDVVLTKEDVLENKPYPDGCVPTGWAIDLHLADPRYDKGFEGDGFISVATFTHYDAPYWIPYRCLYSRNVNNLFMAGRDISVTHDALGTVRVMRTGGCEGEIIGMAASLCSKHKTTPRGVYREYLAELQGLMQHGTGKPVEPSVPLSPPGWLKSAGVNLALSAQVHVEQSRDAQHQPPSLINDGCIDVSNNATRWLSPVGTPHEIDFTWDKEQVIGAARIVSGYLHSDGHVGNPIGDFQLQAFDGRQWAAIPQAAVVGNEAIDRSIQFPAVSTRRVRFCVTKTHTDVSRIWEIELYGDVTGAEGGN